VHLAIAMMCLAVGHQYEHPKVLRLGVLADRVLFNVSYDVNPGEDARLHRSLFDRDGSGVLDEGEKKKLEQYLIDTALLFFKLSIDGKKIVPERVETKGVRLDAAVGSTEALGVAFVLSAPLPAGPIFTLELADRDKDRARHVPLVVDLSAGYEVLLSVPGELFPEARQIHRIMLKEGEPLFLKLARQRAT
jgi:hypothetical protein